MSSHTPQTRTQAWLGHLKDSGYRLTASRRAVVRVLAESDRALNATEIYDLARQVYPSLGLVSVYRTLDTLEALELIQRVHQPDECHAYLAAFNGHQHLVLCQVCGSVNFFRGDDLEALFDRVERESGFQINEHWLQLFGVCAECRQEVER